MKKIALLAIVILILSAKDFNDLNKKAINYYKQGDFNKSLSIWDKLCKKGNITACNNEAFVIYNKSVLLNKNQSEAIKILENVLKKHPNNSSIMYNLAVMYWFGYVEQGEKKATLDRKKAVKLLEKAIKLGNKSAKVFYDKLSEKFDLNATKSK